MIIRVKDIISNCFSMNEADCFLSKINEALEKRHKNESIEIDFSGIKYFTQMFFNLSLTRHLDSMNEEEFNEIFILKNLPESGQFAYQYSYDHAVEYFKLNSEEREKWNEIIEEVLQEM